MARAIPAGLNADYWSTFDLPPGAGVSEVLAEGEAWIGGWDGVGLYEGWVVPLVAAYASNNKVPAYETLSVHLTTHRLILVPEGGAKTRALDAPLSAVRQTEFYMGFMRSSPKITLFLGRSPVPEPSRASLSISSSSSLPPPVTAPVPAAASWTCGVCGFPNPLPPGPGNAPPPATKCQLCGVAYATSRSMSPPATRAGTPASAAASPAEPVPTPSPAPPPEPAASSDQVACPACTFLNHKYLSHCEICGTGLPKASGGDKKVDRQEPKPPAGPEKHDVVRLSFRKGGEKEAYRRLKGVLSDKVWERVAAGPPRRQASGDENGDKPGAGIDAIMKAISLDARAHDEGMQDAFKDLEVLMVRAGEMNLNAKLSAAGAGAASEEEATLVRSSLVQLGLRAPALTQDMADSEQGYLRGLAHELGGILTGRTRHEPQSTIHRDGLMLQPGHGVIALDTVWGLWMRARGIALLPPITLMNVIFFLPGHTSPSIRSLTLPSGLMVLHTPMYAPPVLLARLVERMSPRDDDGAEVGMSIIDIAAVEGLPIGLATELVEMIGTRAPASGIGIVCDDQTGPGEGGRKWYRDIISGWPLEGVGAA
ncbi:Vacuolar protein-sorting-associated protein 36 [Vanrija albida]|uniref:Vacuolar protein-sorting-associated protein 36 n=1 Tax=Vanrija albida TaxID=181172 RepID=A0ABR3Q211_9TREE